jgi:hypothetical protein
MRESDAILATLLMFTAFVVVLIAAVPGSGRFPKVGCTTNYRARCNHYGVRELEVLLTLPRSAGDAVAADVERSLAEAYGYSRGVDYCGTGWNVYNRRVSSETRRERARKAGRKGMASQLKAGTHITQRPDALREVVRKSVTAQMEARTHVSQNPEAHRKAIRTQVKARTHMNQRRRACRTATGSTTRGTRPSTRRPAPDDPSRPSDRRSRFFQRFQ